MARQRIRVTEMNQGRAGRSWEAEHLLRVGRLDGLEVVLTDASISRQHAEVAVSEWEWVLRDLGSTNGTFLNGVRVGRADRKLKRGDTVQFGHVIMQVTALEVDLPTGGDTRSQSVAMQVKCAIDQGSDPGRGLAGDIGCVPAAAALLAQVGRDFYHVGSVDEYLDSILREAAVKLEATFAAAVLRDEATEQLVLRASWIREELSHPRPRFSKTLVNQAMRQGQSLLCHGQSRDLGPRLLGLEEDPGRSIICALLRSPRKPLGVLYFERGIDQRPFGQADLHTADSLAATVSPSVDSIGHLLDKERDLLIQTLTTLAQMVDLRDDYTGSHTQRVTDYALLLAQEMGLSNKELHHLRIGTPLHDIGKIGISDAILRKTTALTAEESEYMKSHTVKGAALLETIPSLAPILPIVRNHHERWDGTGYPDNLIGEQIDLLARIVAVADTFDAMTTDRPYRQALSLEQAFAEIAAKSGAQFDPGCAAAFLRLKPRLHHLFDQKKQQSETISARSILKMLEQRAPSTRVRTVAVPRSRLTMAGK